MGVSTVVVALIVVTRDATSALRGTKRIVGYVLALGKIGGRARASSTPLEKKTRKRTRTISADPCEILASNAEEILASKRCRRGLP